MGSPWRRPAESSTDLYPHLWVTDNVQSGSICFESTRLPIWSPHWAVDELEHYTFDGDPVDEWEQAANGLVNNMLQMRGEWARLLLVLADADRCAIASNRRPWWHTKRHRKRVADQLRRCLAVLEDE